MNDQQLASAPDSLELPTDFPRPAVPTFRGATHDLLVAAPLTAALRTLGQDEHATLFIAMVAAWQVLLSRYSGQDDISVGTPIEGFETRVLRTDLSGNPTFRELLRRVRDVTLSQSHLFQVTLTMQAGPASGNTAKCDLTLSLQETADSLRGSLDYNADLFFAATITRLVGHFQVLLAGIVADPDHPVGQLPLLTEAERHQVLVAWNNATADYPHDRCVHTLFEAQVEKTPDAVAVVFEGQTLTYRELNGQANRLASFLCSLGVGPEVGVGLYLERSDRVVMAILGVLKAGGAYVPIDPIYPVERQAFMVTDAAVPILLTQRSLRETAAPGAGVTVICLDDLHDTLALENPENPNVPVTPENLAYIIYTSGSTGKPKGTLVTHANVAWLMGATRPLFDFGPQDVWTLFHTYAFDVSVWEMWGALMYGGRLVVVPYLVSRSPDVFHELLRTAGVTVLSQTPSAFRQLLAADSSRPCLETLRTVIFAGEALDLQMLRPWIARYGDQRPRLVNCYGITETTVHTTFRLIREADVTASQGSVIGRAIPDAQLYVLDDHGQPVPPLVAGELHVAGGGVSRGYLRRPEVTSTRFVPNPFGAGRLYKSGDRVRYRPDGDLEYLGRLDTQVKLRGFRIELGEIENALLSHPKVVEATVVVREDVADAKRLVAYLVTSHPVPAAELHSHLTPSIPQYMMPAAFVTMDRLPLTVNGKLDRRALPAPDTSSQAFTGGYDAPRDAIEEHVATLWGRLLGIERVGIHANVFLLGGHSLLAAKFVSETRSQLHVCLSLRDVFDLPTIAGLAGLIKQQRDSLESTGLTANAGVPRAPRHGHVLPSFAQERLWFFDQLHPGQAVYNLPWGLRLKGPLRVAALEGSLRELVKRHEVLRTTISAINDQPFQQIHAHFEFHLALSDLRAVAAPARETEARRLADEEAARPFELARDLMLRARLIRIDEDEHWLVLTMHHIAADGWSLGVFKSELAALYEAGSNNRPSRLPDLPVQYADYATWQRQWLQGEVLDQQLAYWKQQLSGAPELLELPTDFPRPAVQSFRGATQELALDANLTAALRRLSQGENASLFMTVLAAWQVLLSRYSGQEDVSVGAPMAGRRTDLEGLIGFFVNTLVLRTDLSGNPPFRELLRRMRDVTLDAYAHQDLPFEKLVEALHPARTLSHGPLFQVMLAMQPASIDWQLAGLTVSPLPLDTRTARCDLTLSLQETSIGLQGSLEYNTDLFEAATIQRLLGHLQVLLAGIVANPDQPIGLLPLLTEADRNERLFEGNDTGVDYSHECVHALFEAQVEKTPDAVAVVFDDLMLTYRELNGRANHLASYLRSVGVGPEVGVGLYLERSHQVVVAILGVLKAGGAYVPIDPMYPVERRAFMVADAAVPILLTQRSLRDTAAAAAGVTVVCLEDLDERLSLESHENLDIAVTPENLAYVIFTSGSTGKPKGTLVTHANVAWLMGATQTLYDFGPHDVWTLFHSYAFDFSVWEMWGALLHGGRLVVVPYLVSRSPDVFHELLRTAGVTVLNQTPSAFRQLVATDAGCPRLDSVHTVILGGESLDLPSLDAWFARYGDQTPRLVNGYGITETTVFTTMRRIWEKDVAAGKRGVIGKAIPGARLYVLDDYGQPVPPLVNGELYVGGAGTSRGYLQRPDLTATRFISNPFGQGLLYRSGDLVRLLPDGDLEYQGRRDTQVKLRGYRIELGEIETVLGAYPGVRETAVLLREGQLVAYIAAAAPENGPSAPELSDFLRQQLPVYMIPSAFVIVNALPLSPNGKLDRQALPAPDTSSLAGGADYVPPRDALEEQMASLWSGLLGVEKVGLHNNFFLLGGHSLLAARLVVQARSQGHTGLSLRDVFEAPTVAGLADLVRQRRDILQGTPGHEEESKALLSDASGWLLLRPKHANAAYFKVFRTGAGQPPVLCVGDARFVPLILQRLPDSVPVLFLGLDGYHVWPPQYLTLAQQIEAYLEVLKNQILVPKAAVVGFSYGGLLAYALASALLQRGLDHIELNMIEPSLAGRNVPIGLKLETLLRRARLSRLPSWIGRLRVRLVPRSRADVATIDAFAPPDICSRWELMEAHYYENARHAHLVPLTQRIGLVGTRAYLEQHAAYWNFVESGGVDQCQLPVDEGHVHCFREECGIHWLHFLESSYQRLCGLDARGHARG